MREEVLMPTDLSTVRRRPKDRKEQILEAARALIVEVGYRNVSMAMIADRVGITAGALYRHFANKSVLLGAVIEQSFDEVTPTFGSRARLADALAESCERAVSHQDVGALWWREARNLPDEKLEELRERLRVINKQYADLVAAERPTLPEEQAEELAWGVQSILASPSSHTSRIPEPEFAALLTAVCAGLCETRLPAPSPAVEQTVSRLEPVSKREALLGHAIVLFGEKGYEATGLDEIGAAAGVSGPNLYSYFDSKADLLQAAVERGTSALWLLLHTVLRENSAPKDALGALVSGYVELASNKTILTSLLQAEQSTLSDEARVRQREYVAEWTALLRACRPQLDQATARVLVHTGLGVVHTLARIEHLRANATLRADLAAMTLAVLFSG
ncbi:putative TetR family transcriptional regulator [Rhodococcus opacus B4]|uniref:Putative TetR family transcriptional regulator n=2 Tax=Rhodococcus opacus TaxID=37919 RepID=C1B2J3_RHOOB|nr:putative TetR family transcriptional regulator [Rhodococcus opacus B4]